MQNRIPWWWLVLLGVLLLAPGPAGRLVLDLLGGLTLFVVLLPLALGGLGWVGWLLLQRRLRTCPACGFRSLGSEACPACGTLWGNDGTAPSAEGGFDARDVTIDVQAKDVDRD